MCRRQSQPSSKSDTEMDKKLKQEDRKFSNKTDADAFGQQSCKLSMKQRILYKKIGKSCDKINGMADKKCRSVESEYQRISDATSQKVHEPSRSSPGSPKCKNKSKGQTGKTKKKVTNSTFNKVLHLVFTFYLLLSAHPLGLYVFVYN